jgi:sulfide:quinone oxidoreductase
MSKPQPSAASNGNRVVILGGGVGGLSTAAALRTLLPDLDSITVVDKDISHVQGLSLLWLLRGWRQPDDVVVSPTEDVLPGVQLLHSEVNEIDLEKKSVKTSRRTLPYDALVIALGAELNVHRIEGLPEALDCAAADQFYTPAGAEAAHHSLSRLRSGRVVILVTSIPYKCPGAPWESAFLTDDLLHESGARNGVDLHIYTPEAQPMPVAGPVVGAELVQLLAARNIHTHFNESLTKVDADRRQLSFASGQQTDFDYALVVPPHQPPTPVSQLHLSDPGWAPVDAYHLTTAVEGVWALGDSASITLVNGKPLPKAAVFARGQANAVAAGVTRYLGSHAPNLQFDGHGHCFLEMGSHLAAKGAGNFYAPTGPDVQLQPPSAENHHEKQREEQSWLAQWSTETTTAHKKAAP